MSGTWKIRNSDLHDIDLAVMKPRCGTLIFGYWVYARDQQNINCYKKDCRSSRN